MNTTFKLSQTAESYARFAQFCIKHQLEPNDIGRLVMLARRAFKAGVTDTKVADKTAARDKSRERFEEYAEYLGFKTQWDGLWPTINRKDAFGYEVVSLPNFQD